MKNKYILYLHSIGCSQKELMDIFSVEKSAEDFFVGLDDESLSIYIKNTKRREKILELYSVIKIKNIDRVVEKLGVNIIVLGDEDYPEHLKNIPHTPYVLYVRGKLPAGDMFGVVGSRKISSYGEKVIQTIVPEISNIFPIVSGGAAGCDSFAHKACLGSGNSTVVVVGTGIDQTYPITNEKLFSIIVENGGAIVSIFRIGEPGNPYNFPVRNEIVVGLSRGVLVIEAKEKSGSLITAGLALDLGKDLFSIPGDILSPNYTGTNMLIKKGEAKCVTHHVDVLEEYNISVKRVQHKETLEFSDDVEQAIYEIISHEGKNIDEISASLTIPTQQLLVKASMLELKGVIKKDLQGKYQLS